MVPVPSDQKYLLVPQSASEHADTDRRPRWAVAPFGGNNAVVVAVASGWPWLAASGQDRWLQQPNMPSTHVSVARFELGAQQFRIPLVPLWSGFVANALVYLPFVLAGLALLARHNRSRRRSKNRCIACNYDLSGARGPCPECGTLDPARAK